jgi:hypothetical protein
MRATLLAADLDELARVGVSAGEAFERGAAALGARPLVDRPTAEPGTEASVQELVHRLAESYAQMRLLQFAFATAASRFRTSKGRYRAVERELVAARRNVVPELRRRLAEVRAREEALARALEERGGAAGDVGPIVPPELAQATSPRPGESGYERRTLPPLEPQPPLLARLRAKLRGEGGRS